MDVHYLTGLLISDPDKIFGVLEALGYEPKDRNRYITCRNLDGDNSSAIVIYKDKLTYKNYTRDRSGNLITLIMELGLSEDEMTDFSTQLIQALTGTQIDTPSKK